MHGSKGGGGASPRQCRWEQETIGSSSRAYDGGQRKALRKVGEDFEQVHESYRKFHPVFVENW